MCKNFCFAIAAVVLFAASAHAKDDLLAGGKINLSSVRDADNTVVEPKMNLNFDAMTAKTAAKSTVAKSTDKNEVAVEACCRGYGGCRRSCCYSSCYSPCYSSCYSSCYCPSYCYSSCYYPSYSYCYYPSYSCCYQPSYSCCYTPSYSCCYQPSYSCCSSNWGCY